MASSFFYDAARKRVGVLWSLLKKGTCHAEPFAALEGKLREARRGGLFLVKTNKSRSLAPLGTT